MTIKPLKQIILIVLAVTGLTHTSNAQGNAPSGPGGGTAEPVRYVSFLSINGLQVFSPPNGFIETDDIWAVSAFSAGNTRKYIGPDSFTIGNYVINLPNSTSNVFYVILDSESNWGYVINGDEIYDNLPCQIWLNTTNNAVKTETGLTSGGVYSTTTITVPSKKHALISTASADAGENVWGKLFAPCDSTQWDEGEPTYSKPKSAIPSTSFRIMFIGAVGDNHCVPGAWQDTSRPFVPIEFQPVYSDGGLPPDNSAGMVVGETMTYVMDYPDWVPAEITLEWSIAGDELVISSATDAKTVDVRGVSPGDGYLRLKMGNVSILQKIEVFQQYITVPVKFYIISSDVAGGGKVTSFGEAAAMLTAANKIWRQAGIQFQATGFEFIAKPQYKQIQDASELRDMWSERFNTGMAEIYFVTELFGGLAGANTNSQSERGGLVVKSGTDVKVLAHELGHLLRLHDIYVAFKGGDIGDEKIRESWLPEDWSNYYPAPLTQAEILPQLLMYGETEKEEIAGGSVDVPAGHVHGVDRDGKTTMVPVGLDSLDRSQTFKHW